MMKSLIFLFILSCLVSCENLVEQELRELQQQDDEETVVLVDGVEANQHRVFVSANIYDGNMGSAAAADTLCQNEATNAGLTKTYKALLSDSTRDIVNELTNLGEFYYYDATNTKKLMIESVGDFFSGGTTTYVELTVDVALNPRSSAGVWTGSDDSGVVNGGNCNDWTSNNSIDDGFAGDLTDTEEGLITGENNQSCDQQKHLICISQN